jgi:chromate reductase
LGLNVWAGKPVGVLGVSISATDTSIAQQNLRNILAYHDVLTLAQPKAFLHAKERFFDQTEQLGAGNKQFLHTWMNQYIMWGKRIS